MKPQQFSIQQEEVSESPWGGAIFSVTYWCCFSFPWSSVFTNNCWCQAKKRGLSRGVGLEGQQALNSVNDCRKWFVSLEVVPAQSQCPSQKWTCSSLKIDCAKHQAALGNWQPQFPRQGVREKNPKVPPLCSCSVDSTNARWSGSLMQVLRFHIRSDQILLKIWQLLLSLYFPCNLNCNFKLHMHCLNLGDFKEGAGRKDGTFRSFQIWVWRSRWC